MTDKPDVSKLREGDVVTVRGVVAEISAGLPAVRFGPFGALHISVAPTDIVSVEPRPLKVGDRVRCSTGETCWQLIAEAEGHALIKSGDYVRHEIFATLSPA